MGIDASTVGVSKRVYACDENRILPRNRRLSKPYAARKIEVVCYRTFVRYRDVQQ